MSSVGRTALAPDSTVRRLGSPTAALLMFAASSSAGEVSGNDLLNWRKSKVSMKAVCNGYSLNVVHAHTDFFNTFNQGQAICIPDGVRTRGQIREVIIKYLNDHPERRHFSASSRVAMPFMDAFPCAPPKQ